MKKTILDNSYVIDVPFNLSAKGKVTAIPDNDPKVWKNKVLTLLSTGINERVWYYNYGVNLTNLLFESSSAATEDARTAISEMFITWLPELTLLEVVTGRDDLMGSLTFSIIYSLPDNTTESINITTASLNAAGETIEVL
jgi:phage baseplate assembly protein W